MAERDPSDLIRRVYRGATDPKGWYAVARELTSALRCAPPLLILRLPRRDHQSPGGLALDAVPPFRERWIAALDHFSAWKEAARRQEPGSASRLEALVPRPLVRASRFYRHWMKPQGLSDALQLALSRESGDDPLLLLFRSADAEPFSAAESDLLEDLAPHLDEVLRIRSSLEASLALRRFAFEVLDHERIGLILLDGQARILGSNVTGDRLLSEGDGLVPGREALHAALPGETKRLHQLIAETARRRRAGDDDAVGLLSLSRPSCARPMLVVVRPLAVNRDELIADQDPEIALYVSDPASRAPVPTEVLQALFDFTPAEARLASMLSQGSTLNEIADTLGRSRHTVRNELKRLFSKTHTNRQSELIRLLSFVPSAGEAEAAVEESPREDTDLR